MLSHAARSAPAADLLLVTKILMMVIMTITTMPTMTMRLMVLSTFDEGPDLVLYYKYLLFLRGESNYKFNFNAFDELSPSQKSFAENHLKLFERWWDGWEGKNHQTN